jgi:Tol biopolymer transport system component
VSLAGGGAQANGDSTFPAISADGRFVAFQSKADNLVLGDTNGFEDIFVHDRQTGSTTRVSVGGDGVESDGSSSQPAISANGRFVAFSSQAANLVNGDSNDKEDVFVRDLAESITILVSADKDGGPANHLSRAPAISADGRLIAFESMASDLVENDSNNFTDVFVRNMISQTTARVSVSGGGEQGDKISHTPSITDDGQKVVFISDSTNLVTDDFNYSADAFLRDLAGNTTARVSVASGGGESAGGPVSRAVISGDGGFVAFASQQNGLVTGDTNSREDVFLHDLLTITTTRVSLSGDGAQPNADSAFPAITHFGTHVVFSAEAENLVLYDTNGKWDIFIHRRSD